MVVGAACLVSFLLALSAGIYAQDPLPPMGKDAQREMEDEKRQLPGTGKDGQDASSSCTEAPEWQTLIENIGVSAMHMMLMPNDKIVIWDYTYSSHPSNISLPANQKCIIREDFFHDRVKKPDCWAHSVEVDLSVKTVRPLTVYTDTWCSGGGLDANGTLVQNGGWHDGEFVVRRYDSCPTCDWKEEAFGLVDGRWYATTQVLPDGRFFVIGGANVFTYEYVPRQPQSKSFYLPFLKETLDTSFFGLQNNLYPFVHLLADGNLFIFANTKAILFDHINNKVLKTYPDIPPTGVSRNYPSSGSSVMLALDERKDTMLMDTEVMVCGGSPSHAFSVAQDPNKPVFLPADDTCGRIKVMAGGDWAMEKMPLRRVMGDMLLLPTGDVLIINGASAGSSGWDYGRDPVLTPVLYKPDNVWMSRFQVLSAACKPRMYHSSCHLLRDGRVLVGGSNAHQYYVFNTSATNPFPTDLSLQAFSPPYLNFSNGNGIRVRPSINGLSQNVVSYNANFTIIHNNIAQDELQWLEVNLMAPTLTTHSYSMHQRLVHLRAQADKANKVTVTSPSNSSVAPPGYYMLFLVSRGVPSVGSWIRLSL